MCSFVFLLVATVFPLVFGGDRQPQFAGSPGNFVQLKSTNGKCGGDALLADGQTVKLESGRRVCRNRMCAWSVSSTDPDTNFDVRCPVFDIPWSEGCKRHRLTVGDDTGSANTLCGQGRKHLLLKSNKMWVSYVHRKRRKSKGFMCTVTAVRGNRSPALALGAVGPKVPGPADGRRRAAAARVIPPPWTTCQCGIRGTESLEYPWLASIKLNFDDHEGSSDFGMTALYSYCSGSVINNKYILTAANCVTDEANKVFSASAVEVGLGNHDVPIDGIVGTEQTFQVEKIIIHPNYTHQQADIALLRISEELNITKYRPVCLASDPGEDLATRIGYMIGLDYVTGLWEQEVTIVDAVECESSDNLCASFPDDGMSICLGDMGGPLLLKEDAKFSQAGIAIYGYDCDLVGTVRPYTNVALYYQWIVDNTADAVYCGGDTLLL
ncbi:phenoloxidase-activating factor 1-like [Penaeus japonicus]|uniref:phenoloxidase-activating factor 1-like n=1 Tax=Penaeus japonicus TaxID=27405 RepID=UPI001C716E3B|nr:phenoloxidase-activating factor 1-like [Penaeus japonicus]